MGIEEAPNLESIIHSLEKISDADYKRWMETALSRASGPGGSFDENHGKFYRQTLLRLDTSRLDIDRQIEEEMDSHGSCQVYSLELTGDLNESGSTIKEIQHGAIGKALLGDGNEPGLSSLKALTDWAACRFKGRVIVEWDLPDGINGVLLWKVV